MKKIIEAQAPAIVDLRTPREFEQGHIPGAVNVPVDDLRANRTLLDAYKDKPLLLYCRTVNRTGRVLWMLEGRGFKLIYALKGGYAEYRRLHGN
ncbi:MAG: rhodanese-like domain-containing protein [Smithellaceae bacterium]